MGYCAGSEGDSGSEGSYGDDGNEGSGGNYGDEGDVGTGAGTGGRCAELPVHNAQPVSIHAVTSCCINRASPVLYSKSQDSSASNRSWCELSQIAPTHPVRSYPAPGSCRCCSCDQAEGAIVPNAEIASNRHISSARSSAVVLTDRTVVYHTLTSEATALCIVLPCVP